MSLTFKYGHAPELRPDGAVWIGPNLHGRATQLRDPSGVLWEVCEALDGTRSRDGVIAAALERRADAEARGVGEIIDYFVNSGWVEDDEAPIPAGLTERDLERHSRGAVFLSAVDFRPGATGYGLQARLKASSVAVLGLGGVGSAVAMSLAASGIGRLHCVDHDKVELSNLNRQLLYTEHDIGEPKVRAAVSRLRALNGDIEVTGSASAVDGPDAIAREIEGCDIAVLCADTPSFVIREWMDEATWRLGVPWLCAHYDGPKFSTACFIPGRTPCHSCLRETARQVQAQDGRAPVLPSHAGTAHPFHAVLAPSAQISGHYLAMEAIKLLLGLEVQTAGRELCRFVTDYEQWFYHEARSQPDCRVRCGERAEAVERTAP